MIDPDQIPLRVYVDRGFESLQRELDQRVTALHDELGAARSEAALEAVNTRGEFAAVRRSLEELHQSVSALDRSVAKDEGREEADDQARAHDDRRLNRAGVLVAMTTGIAALVRSLTG